MAGLADPVPLGEGERRGLDRAAVDGRYEEAGAGQVGKLLGPEGQGHDRHRGVLEAGQLDRRRGRHLGQQTRGRRAGRGQHDLVGKHLFGGRRRPDDQREAGRRTTKLAHRRARADVEPVRQGHRRAGPGHPRSRRTPEPRCAASTLAAAASTSRPLLHATSCGTVARAERLRAWPAYTPPSSGSTSRSTTSSPSRVATSSPTETSSPSATGWPLVSWRSRSTPASLSTPDAATWSRSAGTPITERGSGRSAPLVQTDDEEVAGWTTSSPSACASSMPSGRRASIASAPRSTPTPATSPTSSLPPTRDDPSRTDHLAPGGGQVASGGQARDAGADHDGTARRVGHAPSLSPRSAG